MSDCIEWQGHRNKLGYGRFDDIDGLAVMHLCDNPPCVNVDHLRLGTQADNNADREAKGRGRRPLSSGEAHGNAKLTEYAVRWVRSYHATGDYTQQELADMYGIRRSTAGRIITRERWKHV